MDTSFNQYEYKDEEMTLDSKPPTPDPPNNGQVIDSNDEMEAT